MKYNNDKFSIVGDIHGFVGFYPIGNNIYLVSNFFRVGPDLRTTETNHYTTYILKDGQIVKLDSLPKDLYGVLYSQITKGHISNDNFYETFFFLYNNNPSGLSIKFIDDNFKSNSEADKIYISTDNVQKLFQDETSGISFDIYTSKYFYYYLLETIK